MREFGLFVTLPMTLLITARFVPESLSLILTGAAVVWLVAGLLRISRYGPSSGSDATTLALTICGEN